MRSSTTVLSCAALAAAALALGACGSAEPAAPSRPPAQSSGAQPGPAAEPSGAQPGATAAAQVGAATSACPLPVTFGLAESYKPKAVKVEQDDPLAELSRRGPLTMACEVDAKPAGNIGFLRVWTGAKGEPRPILTAFIGKRALKPAFTELQIGGRPGLEVVYQQKNQLDDAIDQERAFLVETGQGVTVVSLDSLDSDEYEDILPAYELARTSLTVTG